MTRAAVRNPFLGLHYKTGRRKGSSRSLSAIAHDQPLPDMKAPAKAIRRRFTAANKARILDAHDSTSPIERPMAASAHRASDAFYDKLSDKRYQLN
jgi:hypothetical protein